MPAHAAKCCRRQLAVEQPSSAYSATLPTDLDKHGLAGGGGAVERAGHGRSNLDACSRRGAVGGAQRQQELGH